MIVIVPDLPSISQRAVNAEELLVFRQVQNLARGDAAVQFVHGDVLKVAICIRTRGSPRRTLLHILTLSSGPTAAISALMSSSLISISFPSHRIGAEFYPGQKSLVNSYPFLGARAFGQPWFPQRFA
jgi:hypothetical protein